MSIEALFQHPTPLPAAPKVVQELISSFNDENVSADDIAKKLAADPVLSAKLLRLANSAYYRVSRSVSTVNNAVLMLGFVTVRTLVISSGLVNAFKSAPGLDLKKFWRYSLNTAVAAKWLAQHAEENSELAFTVGMTHGIGQLILHASMPEKTAVLDKATGILADGRMDAERKSLGYDYAEISAELAARWKFPVDFVEALRAFPKPLEQEPLNRVAAILHLASYHARVEATKPADPRAAYPNAVAAALGMDAFVTFDKMPPLAELSEGLEELIA